MKNKPQIDVEALPKMTHLQFAVAVRMPASGLFAVELIERTGIRGPRFYQLLNRMILMKFVLMESRPIYGTREGTFYALTNAGSDEVRRCLSFYRNEGVRR